MKKYLQNSTVALLCAVVIVLGSTLGNLNRNLSTKVQAVEELWTGKYGIVEKLEERCSSASQLWSVLHEVSALEEECAEVRSAYNALYDLDLDMAQAASLYTANERLSAASASLLSAAREECPESRNLELAESYYSDMVNAQRVLEQSSYHEALSELNDLFSAPHIALLRPFLRVTLPEEFA